MKVETTSLFLRHISDEKITKVLIFSFIHVSFCIDFHINRLVLAKIDFNFQQLF